MTIFKCKMCGGALNIEEGMTVCECEYCGSKQTVPAANDEKIAKLFERANRLRFNSEFDKAYSIYESIIAEDPEAAEAYWGLVLCKYGVEYVDDPATLDKVPTCHRSSFESVMDDENFEQVMETADSFARAVYREQAKQIEKIRKGIIEVSDKEKPYDIFICYKETAEDGQRTIDSVLAQDVYDALTAKGYRVFFSRITLEDKLGTEYEPYIFAALNSAKVMLAFGTSYDCYNAVWVKNEWSRYLKLMEKDKKKHLIPCYKDIDAYDMPKEFARLQAQDMGKVGAVQDLLRGIEKLIGTDEKKADTSAERGTQPAANPNAASLLERAFMFLEDGDWTEADRYCDRVLDIEPKCAEAYLGKLMAELEVREQEQLRDQKEPFDQESNYQKVIRFGDESLKKTVAEYIEHIQMRNEDARKESIYRHAMEMMKNADTERAYEKSAELFDSISEYMDAAALAEKCFEKVRTCHEARIKIKKLLSEYKKTYAQERKQKKQLEGIENEKESWKVVCQQLQDQQNELKNIETEAKACTENLMSLQEELAECNAKKSTLGIFAGNERKELNKKIDDILDKLESCQKTKAECEKQKRALDTEEELEIALADAQKKLREAEAEEKRQEMQNQNVKTGEEILSELEQYGASKFLLNLYQAKEGNCIEFGTYRQSVEPDAKKTAIEWSVLAKEGEKLLLISKYGLDFKPYNVEMEDVTWETSSIRKWLNDEFMEDAFNMYEQELIAETKVKNPNNNKFKTKGGNDTQDKIFLLSIDEAEKYFTSDEASICVSTVYAIVNIGYQDDGNRDCWWWLRSPGRIQKYAAGVFVDGGIDDDGHDVDGGLGGDFIDGGVRPALWINLES